MSDKSSVWLLKNEWPLGRIMGIEKRQGGLFMEERLMRHVADSAVIQTQIILSSHINGAGRLFGGQLMEWIDIVAGVVADRKSTRLNSSH